MGHTKEEIYEAYSEHPIKWMQENKCATTKQITLHLMEQYHIEQSKELLSQRDELVELCKPLYEWQSIAQLNEAITNLKSLLNKIKTKPC